MLINSVRDAVVCEINRLNIVKGRGVSPDIESIIDTAVARLEGIVAFYLQDSRSEPRVAIIGQGKERRRSNEVFSKNISRGSNYDYVGRDAGLVRPGE